MALIPNTFEPGEVAASSEVNANFQAIADVVGNDSSASIMNLPGDLVIGPRDNVQISAKGDTQAGSSTSFVQFSWNAELYNDGSSWKVRRFLSNEPATAVRVGGEGFQIYTTSRTSGDLEKQFTCIFQVKATTGDDFVFIKPSITRSAAPGTSLSDYRLTLVLLDTPAVVYENVTINAGVITRRVTDYGIPTQAKAVLIAFEGKPVSDGQVLFTQARTSRSQRYGFIVSGIASKQSSGQGIVPLGTSGDYVSRFVEDRSIQWNVASLYIQGFFV